MQVRIALCRSDCPLRAGGTRPARIVFAWLLAVLLVACTAPLQPPRQHGPALVLQPAQLAGLRDLRGAYRREFCPRLETPWQAPCTAYLRQFDDEPPAPAPAVQPSKGSLPMTVFVVSGLFNECFPGLLPFGDARARAGEGQVQFVDVPVHGRASTALNAQIVRDFIVAHARQQAAPQVNVILSYSKGTADALAALADSAELAGRIDALLSVAGAVNGSPLADALEGVYALLASVPATACPVTDRGELASLTRQGRLDWLARHPLPSHPRYFSVIAAPTSGRVSALLRLPYAQLAAIDDRNDGQLLAFDAVVPGSALLGYVNADHFAVAVPLLRWHPVPFSVLAKPNDFPRQQMVAAALALIRQQLAAPTRAPPY